MNASESSRKWGCSPCGGLQSVGKRLDSILSEMGSIGGFWEEAWLDMAYNLKNKNFSGCCDHDREDSKHGAQPGGHCSSSGEKSRCSDQGGGRWSFSGNFLKIEPAGLANKWSVGCEGVRETSREISRVWVGVHCTVIGETGRDTFGGTKSKLVLAVLNWRCLLEHHFLLMSEL